MNCLITGGSGFIGSHLAEKLYSKKHKVTIFDNFSIGKKKNLHKLQNKIKIKKIDIRNKKLLEKNFKKFDVVFHLAALADIVPSINNPKEYFTTNVDGSFNILTCCRKFKVRKLIYTASSSCYGIPEKYPTNEKAKINPQYPYALTKWLGEQLLLNLSKLYKINFTSLRLFNVYGPRARTSGTYGAVFGVFLAQKINNHPFTVVGDGKQKRDFTYVSDIVDCLYSTAFKKNLNGEIFNIGSGKTVSVNKIISLLKGKKIFIPKRPGEPDVTFADISKIKLMLNWRPKINVEQGIKLMLKNINYWKNAPLWTPRTIKIATKDWFKYLKNEK